MGLDSYMEYELFTITGADPSYCCGFLVTFAITLGCNFVVIMMISNRLRYKSKPQKGKSAFNSVHYTCNDTYSANIYKF